MGFSRQEYWSGLSCPPLVYLPLPGIEPMSLMSPALAVRFFTTITHIGSPDRGMVHTNVLQLQSAEFIIFNVLTYICIIFCLHVDFLVSSPDFIDDDTEYLRGEFLIYSHS